MSDDIRMIPEEQYHAELLAQVRRALAEGRWTLISDDGVYVPPPVEPEVDGSPTA